MIFSSIALGVSECRRRKAEKAAVEVWAGGAARLWLGWGSIFSCAELSYSGNHCLHCPRHQRHPKLDDLKPAPLSGFLQPLPRQQQPHSPSWSHPSA